MAEYRETPVTPAEEKTIYQVAEVQKSVKSKRKTGGYTAV